MTAMTEDLNPDDIYFQSFFESEYSGPVVQICSYIVELHVEIHIKIFFKRNLRFLNMDAEMFQSLKDNEDTLEQYQIMLKSMHEFQKFYGEEIQEITNFFYAHLRHWDGKIAKNEVNSTYLK